MKTFRRARSGDGPDRGDDLGGEEDPRGGDAPKARRSWAARTSAGLGELCMTAGVVLLLFCAYQLWWTNVEAAQARSDALGELRSSWQASTGPDYGAPAASDGPQASGEPDAPEPPGSSDAPTPDPSSSVPARTARPPVGTPLALIRIPRLGADWVQPIVEGVEAEQLHEGIGHYIGTALPGERGNLALAGHRATNGEPFRNLDRMRTGDTVVVETRDTVYTYVVDKPWTLVLPDAVQVIAPVPGHPGQHATARKMTLTTCNPRWASTQRLIVDLTLRSAVRRA